MRKIFLFFFALILFLSAGLKTTYAIYDPTLTQNNKVGIHITDMADLEDAAKLVNSSGGDWGYVTFVIQKTDRNKDFWQLIFDKCRKLHLIPMVRIATRPMGDIWEKPSLGDNDGWVSFLNSLNWVISNRYVIIGNEPNHAKEWGGEVNPEEYVAYLTDLSSKLKKTSSNYFILPAGLDSSAANTGQTMDEYLFLKRMYQANPEFSSYIDGLASHSYPNPDFSGSEYDSGRRSIKSYLWELGIYKEFGLNNEIPVFITETGWAHRIIPTDKKYPDPDKLGVKFEYAFNYVWSDSRIIAVTPFVLSYKQPPFEIFSWRKQDNTFYSFYDSVKNIKKQKGTPIQTDKSDILAFYVFPYQLTNSRYTGIFLVKNTGQSIWNKNELIIHSTDGVAPIITSTSFIELEPNQVGLISFNGTAKSSTGSNFYSVALYRNNLPISKKYDFHLVTISPLKVKVEAIFARIRAYLMGR